MKNLNQKLDEKLKERFLNIYKYCNHDNNTFILLSVYSDEYMDDW